MLLFFGKGYILSGMEESQNKRAFKAQRHDITFLTVYNTGTEKCRAGHCWGPAVRDHFLIHFIVGGKGVYTLAGKDYALSTGDMFFAPPGESICYRADADDPWEYCWVGFQGIDAAAMSARAGLTPESPVRHFDDLETPRRLIYDIIHVSGVLTQDSMRMTGCLCFFLAWLTETANRAEQRAEGSSMEHVRRACAFIANNYSRPISINEITRAVGVCRSRLYRAFEEQMGVSPARYLTHFRIEQARMLLETSDLSVKSVAYSVGFEDPLYFSRRFRELVGCPPRAYAQKEQE